MPNRIHFASTVLILLGAGFHTSVLAQEHEPNNIKEKIVVSDHGRFLKYETGEPFFWLGDTGWLLLEKLTREETLRYRANREAKGFNVLQCVVVHSLPLVNAYNDSAFVDNDISRPLVTPGNFSSDPEQYDFWDHVDFVIDEAAKNGIRVALVPIWGSVALRPTHSLDKIVTYVQWLAKRFGSKPNIFWINGGDVLGSRRPEVWNAIGIALRSVDSIHLITFHPFGRTQSSMWFHEAPWLDFNMFQSGHRRYDQLRGDGAEKWEGGG
jgi:hypothetical protein